MDKRTLAAIVLSLGIWLTWQKLYWQPHQEQVKAWQEYQQSLAEKEKIESGATLSGEAAGDATKVNSASGVESLGTTGNTPRKLVRPEIAKVSLHKSLAFLSNSDTLLQNWQLSDYQALHMPHAKADDVIDLKYVTGLSGQVLLSFEDPAFAAAARGSDGYTVIGSSETNYSDRVENDLYSVERNATKGASPYTLDVVYKIKFKGTVPNYVFFDLLGSPKRENDSEGSILGGFPDKVELLYWGREGRSAAFADSISERKEEGSGVRWVGVNTRYFLLSLVPDGTDAGSKSGVQFLPGDKLKGMPAKGRLVYSTGQQRELLIPLRVYFGPKKLEYLTQVTPSLTNAVDFGWTTVIAVPLLKALKWFYSYVGNYGIAIILLTLVVKILLFPLTYKSMKSMAKMAKLKPQMEKLQAKYKDDKQKLQTELLSLYKTNGANPVSGCLPMLLQMPVFFALYRVLFNCMELYQAPFFGWINDLSAADPFFVTPVILIVLMYFQQLLMPNTSTDPNQQMVMRFMPVLFGVFMLFLPAGLNIYMLVNTLFSVGQQFILNKKFGLYDQVASNNQKNGKQALSGA